MVRRTSAGSSFSRIQLGRASCQTRVCACTRKLVIEAGWLEQTEKLGHIKYFRLDPRRLGENVVGPLRRAT
ncbi:hypothetical protein [Streptomyces sp. NPDC060187]|uniref:hypothetical protein n=1 Tax=Streptomyces sp. NPDC060187 TaxID=3347067 RepID=UPI0036661BAF